VQVSDQGSVSVEGAKGLDENAVVGISETRGGQTIFCRCKGADVLIDGKKPQSSGHDRYKLPTQGQAAYALTLVRGDNRQPIMLQASDPKHAEIHIASPAQVIVPPPPAIASDVQGRPTPVVAAPVSTAVPVQAQPPPPTPRPSPIPPPAQTAIPADEVAWNKVKDSTDISVLRKFRTDNPTSKFESLAYAREEGLAWANVHEPPQIADLQQFLNQYSNGPHAAEARKRIDSLKDQDRQDIKQTLESYRSAYEKKDLNALAAVWLTVPRAQFQQTFKAADKIHVTLDQKDPLINGDTATVDCSQRLEFVANGKVSHFDVTKRFSLRKLQGRWFIEKDN